MVSKIKKKLNKYQIDEKMIHLITTILLKINADAVKKIVQQQHRTDENVQASTNVQYPICGGLTKKQTPCPFNIDPSKPWNIGRGSAVTTIMRHPWNSQKCYWHCDDSQLRMNFLIGISAAEAATIPGASTLIKSYREIMN